LRQRNFFEAMRVAVSELENTDCIPFQDLAMGNETIVRVSMNSFNIIRFTPAPKPEEPKPVETPETVQPEETPPPDTKKPKKVKTR
jgi:outer membrane biosynthesis protein TonB